MMSVLLSLLLTPRESACSPAALQRGAGVGVSARGEPDPRRWADAERGLQVVDLSAQTGDETIDLRLHRCAHPLERIRWRRRAAEIIQRSEQFRHRAGTEALRSEDGWGKSAQCWVSPQRVERRLGEDTQVGSSNAFSVLNGSLRAL